MSLNKAKRANVKESHTSAQRLMDYTTGDLTPYQRTPVRIFCEHSVAEIVPFDDGLFRHDLRVVLHSRNVLAELRV